MRRSMLIAGLCLARGRRGSSVAESLETKDSHQEQTLETRSGEK